MKYFKISIGDGCIVRMYVTGKIQHNINIVIAKNMYLIKKFH